MPEPDHELLEELEPDWNILEPEDLGVPCARCRAPLGELGGVAFEGELLCRECLVDRVRGTSRA